MEQRKTILTIGMNDCRYPIGEPTSPDFFFCGAPKVEHGPYCAHHMKRCYYTPTSKPFSASYINRVR
jgi:GcrA cell cycle regulator